MIKGLPERLKKLRKKYGLSQKQVAERIGVSASIVSGYKTGERTPSTDILLSLSYLYQCTTDYLLGKENNLHSFLNSEGLSDDQLHALQMLINSIRSK